MTERDSPARRALHAGLFGVAAITALILTAGSVGAQQFLYPDLVSDPPEQVMPVQELEWPEESGRRILTVNFDGFVHNAGAGPLIIRGNPQPGAAAAARPHQWARTSSGSEHRVQPVEIYFATEDNHNHWHLDGAMEYALYDESRTRKVTPGAKVGFCMLDSEPAPDQVRIVDPAPQRFTFVEGVNCASGSPAASQVEMGVSVGWRDEYARNLEQQWIDVSDVAPGRYYVGAASDPEDVIRETRESNNDVAFAASPTIVPGYAPRHQDVSTEGPVDIQLDAPAFTDPDAATTDGIDTYFSTDRGPEHFAELGPPRFEITAQPVFGSVDVDVDTGAARYVPIPGYNGPDTFSYTVYDRSSEYPRTRPTAEVDINGGLPVPFTDVPVGHVFFADISWMYGEGITKGCDTTLFCPGDPVTRGQLASFLVRALGLEPAGGDTFGDDDTSVHEADIQALAASGITRGCAPDRFCPTDPVTRGQLASFLVRALDDLEALPGVDTFGDDDSSVHEADIEGLAASGITRGCDTAKFCPTDPVTRGQLAAFLHRALG